MFWTYNTTSPQIDIILCKEDLTLQELLDQENVLQELKAQNLKLIEFLIKPDILRELVHLITTEPSQEVDEAEQYKYANLACELLTSDLPALNERLASEEILNKLYCFLQNDPPLNPLLSSYFSRTLSILINRKSGQNWFSYQYTCLQALEFLKAKQEFIELLLKHMGTSSIMDLMHNLLTLIEGPELKQSLWIWLQSQNVIPNLISLLSPHADTDCQMNAASVLCSLRDNLADTNDKSESDPILNLLESSEITELLLCTIFSGDTLSETSIESGIDVLLAIMKPYLPGDARCRQSLNYSVHDKMESGLVILSNSPLSENISDNSAALDGYKNIELSALSEITTAILPYIKKLRDVLLTPIKKDPIKLTSGIICPPFGKARLLVAKLIHVLISLNTRQISKEIMHCDIPELLLDLFYAYSSNNFLHTEVEKLIAYAIDQVNGYVIKECNDDLFFCHLLKKCDLLNRILSMWQENSDREERGFYRRGYMGHVIRIATLIHIEDEKNPVFHELLVEEVPTDVLSRWNDFINNSLISIIEKHSSCLGGVRPKLTSFEETISNKELKSNDKDYDQEDDENVIFSSDTITGFGEEVYHLNNELSEEEEERQAEIFNSVCSQKWQSFTKGLDNLGDDEDEESDRISMWRSPKKSSTFRLWDSDDENVEEDLGDSSDPWSKLGSVADPWGNSTCSSAADTSWNANNSTNWANFEENFNDADTTKSNVIQSRSTLVTNADQQYSLFGNTIDEKSSILNNFSNVKICVEPSPLSSEFENDVKLMNGDWPGTNSGTKKENQSETYTIQQSYSCFAEQEMLDLESISGNTLAEKIANAENDIRNKDEIRLRGMQEQSHDNFDLMNSFEIVGDQRTCSSSEHGDVSIRAHMQSEDSEEELSVDHEKLNEQSSSFLLQQDCLTENSVDFVTADNSTSDAESSVEFGDAENSLELELEVDEFTEKVDKCPMASALTDECDMSGDQRMTNTENVPIVDEINDACNNMESCVKVVEKEESIECDVDQRNSVVEVYVPKTSTESSSCLLVNGDVTDHERQINCDKINDTCDSGNLPKKEVDNNMNGAIMEEPA